MSRISPAVWMARKNGSIHSQNTPARQLLGDEPAKICWDLLDGLEQTEGLPCHHGCVRELLCSGVNQIEHNRVRIEGQGYQLSCIPVAGEVLCMLSHNTDNPPQAWQKLTPRERDVLELLAAGETSASAADILGLSESTVRTHVEKMLNKLDVNNRAALVANGFRLGYLN